MSELSVNYDFDIILLTHNHLEQTIKCVDAIYNNTTDFSFRLTVSDDSTDSTPEYFRKLNKYNLQFLHSDKPFEDFDKVLNFGIQNTDCGFVVALTNSTLVEPGWISYALDLIKNNPDIAIVGVKSVKPNGLIENAGIFVCDNDVMCVGTDEPGHRYSFIYDVDAVGGNCCLYRRELIKDGFGTSFSYYLPFSGHTDIDHCLTLKSQGWRIVYCGNGAVYHFGAYTRGLNKDFCDKENEDKKRFRARWQHLLNRNYNEVMPSIKGFN